MDDSFKRLNKFTGKPFKAGFQDESGRFFVRYINKHGNDGYYLEDWKKDFKSYTNRLKELGVNSC